MYQTTNYCHHHRRKESLLLLSFLFFLLFSLPDMCLTGSCPIVIFHSALLQVRLVAKCKLVGIVVAEFHRLEALPLPKPTAHQSTKGRQQHVTELIK